MVVCTGNGWKTRKTPANFECSERPVISDVDLPLINFYGCMTDLVSTHSDTVLLTLPPDSITCWSCTMCVWCVWNCLLWHNCRHTQIWEWAVWPCSSLSHPPAWPCGCLMFVTTHTHTHGLPPSVLQPLCMLLLPVHANAYIINEI